MCLGIPMQIVEINGLVAQCEAKGIARDVNLYLMQGQDLQTGDFVMVHVGYAIEKICPADATTAWELYDQMTEAPSNA